MMIEKGWFFVLEGIDGCGKSTQIDLVGTELTKRGFSVLMTCEPTNTELGKRARAMINNPFATTNQKLDLIDKQREEHVKTILLPAIEQKKIILCDRFEDSSKCYQCSSVYKKRSKISFPKPDIVFLFDIPLQEAKKRLKIRNEELPINIFDIQKRYRALKRANIVKINGMLKIEEITEIIIKKILNIINNK